MGRWKLITHGKVNHGELATAGRTRAGTGPPCPPRLGPTLPAAQRVRQAESSGRFRIPGGEIPRQLGVWWLVYVPVEGEEENFLLGEKGLALHGNRRYAGIILTTQSLSKNTHRLSILDTWAASCQHSPYGMRAAGG